MRLGDLDALKAELVHDYAYAVADIVDKQPTIDAVLVAELRTMLSNLESKCCGDGAETYTSGYRNGHHNGQIELLRYILQVPDGTSEDERKGD